MLGPVRSLRRKALVALTAAVALSAAVAYADGQQWTATTYTEFTGKNWEHSHQLTSSQVSAYPGASGNGTVCASAFRNHNGGYGAEFLPMGCGPSSGYKALPGDPAFAEVYNATRRDEYMIGYATW